MDSFLFTVILWIAGLGFLFSGGLVAVFRVGKLASLIVSESTKMVDKEDIQDAFKEFKLSMRESNGTSTKTK